MKWNNVEDGLPDDDYDLILRISYKDIGGIGHCYSVGYYDGEKFRIQEYYEDTYGPLLTGNKVTHWAKIIEPNPKIEEIPETIGAVFELNGWKLFTSKDNPYVVIIQDVFKSRKSISIDGFLKLLDSFMEFQDY